jgi:hypothetical protein
MITNRSLPVEPGFGDLDHQTDHQTAGLCRTDLYAAGRHTHAELRERTTSDGVRRSRWDWKTCDLRLNAWVQIPPPPLVALITTFSLLAPTCDVRSLGKALLMFEPSPHATWSKPVRAAHETSAY